jgi:hypothetical protein
MNKYPEEGKASIMKELNNLVKRDGFGEVDYESLSPQQHKWASPIGWFRVDPRAISKIYNWDRQTYCPRTDCFKLDAGL